MIIAIDGPAASGKGTLGQAHRRPLRPRPSRHRHALSRRGARDLGARRRPGRCGAAASAGPNPRSRHLGRPRPARPGLGEAASIVARHPEVRDGPARLSARLRPRSTPGAVLDGRDIGTVICPDADVKLFVTATPEERARRRYLELQDGPEADATEAEVLRDIRRRDERDARPRRGAHAAGRRRASCSIPRIWI